MPRYPRSRLTARFTAGSAVGILMVIVTGCVSSSPPPAIDVEMREAWSSGPASHDTTDTADSPTDSPRDSWWTDFGDPRLSALVEEALAENYDLLAATSRIDAAVAQARIAGAARKPTVSAGLDGSRRRQNFIGFPIPGSESSVLSSTTTTYGASLNASWEIDLWGRLRSSTRAALAEVDASREDYRAAQLSLAAQTAKSWFALVEATEQVALAEKTLESRRLTSERIQRRFNLGIRGPLDLRLARTNEATATADLAARKRFLDAATRQLEALLTRYPSAELTSPEALPEPPGSIETGVPSEILLRRPDLSASSTRLAAAGFRVEAAKAALYPRLTLSGSLGRSAEALSDLADDDFSVWSLAAGLLQPVFQGGQLRANVELNEAQQRGALEGYRQTILRAFAEVETALASEEFLREQRQAQELAAESAIASTELAERRYDSGLSDYLTVLTAQVTSQQAQSQLLAVRRQQLDARVDLILALGGGWDNPETATSESAEVDEAATLPANAHPTYSPTSEVTR